MVRRIHAPISPMNSTIDIIVKPTKNITGSLNKITFTFDKHDTMNTIIPYMFETIYMSYSDIKSKKPYLKSWGYRPSVELDEEYNHVYPTNTIYEVFENVIDNAKTLTFHLDTRIPPIFEPRPNIYRCGHCQILTGNLEPIFNCEHQFCSECYEILNGTNYCPLCNNQ